MSNLSIKSAIEAVHNRVQTASTTASAEELAYLGTALERIGGRATVLEVVEVADAKLDEMTAAITALGNQQDARLLSRGNEQDARLVSQGDAQVARVMAEGNQQVSVLQAFSPNGVQQLTLTPGQVADVALAAGRHVVVSCSDIGAAVRLPDATTLPPGRSRLTLTLGPGSFPVGVLDATGRVLGQIEPGDIVELHLLDNSMAAGQWDYTGNLAPFWIAEAADFQLLYNSVNAFTFASRYLYYGRDISNFPFIRSVHFSGDSIVTSPMVVLSAVAGENVDQVIEIDPNRYLVRFGGRKLRVVDLSNPAAPLTGEVVELNNNPWRIERFGTREAWAALRINSPNSRIFAVPIDLTGTTLTLGSEVQGTIFCTNWHSITNVYALSNSALGILIQCNNSGEWYRFTAIQLLRNANGSFTFGAAVQNPPNTNTGSANNSYTAFHLGDNTALVFYMDGNQRIRASVCTFDATSSYGADVLMNLQTGSWNYSVAQLDVRRFWLGANNRSELAGQIVDVVAGSNAISQAAVLALPTSQTLSTNVAQIADGRLLLYGSSEYYALVALAPNGTQTVLQANFAGGSRNPLFAANGWGQWSVQNLPNYRHVAYFVSQGGSVPLSQTLYQVTVHQDRLAAIPLAHSEDGSISVSNWQLGRPMMLQGSPRRYGIDIGQRVRFGRDRSFIFNEWLARLGDRHVLARVHRGYNGPNDVQMRHFLLKFAEA